MNIPKIRIETTDALIGITTTKPVQTIVQPKAELDLQQPKAKMTIETTPSELFIDAYEARESMGYQNARSRIAEMAWQGRQDVLEGIARRAQEGQQLMRIEDGGNPIAEQAKLRDWQPYTSLNIKFIPQPGSLKIHYEPAKVDIRIEPQKVINNTKINKPVHEYIPGKVNIGMVYYPSVRIDWLV
ncbi:DUF6470 family protein [Ureibacillus sp. FSL K6-8385]|uniref:YviE n=2 Tax=Ureibacillus terrenus TaxID=118246 RepID=A0A540V3X6_9BACL|nr:DUF6470 family protein [Ureibacillus terrenus]MED3763066.1 DUF6470 family protein [Ureibacillus terrenus]TQE91418.1 hypothetical protein FKZ59_05430 [Ureibacillus terrenus]